MATSVDPLIIGRVIGDVVDMFVPSVNMSVYFGTKHVTNGCHIKPSMAVDPPRITLTGNIDNLYTLVMTDPDAPSPSEPIHRELIHWPEYLFCYIEQNHDFKLWQIVGCNIVVGGNEILPYGGPRPPLGIHRYILVLFEQKGPLDLVEQPPSRASFNTRYFARQLNLGLPVATVYFNSQKEPAYRRRT
ncbi:hypothetical protein TanjilG_21954 [Lupinus angustifolius]|uniref:Uncharacterized protein n=1 Tax=Lupinus angustifolius TaxID=3871 RepID=A0A1J7I7N4_LUPAN|nr:hypothetical protein TanjilG_21954 [Lupinus angustifolius]